MRIALIYATKLRDVPPPVQALARGMEAMGHRVDILDAKSVEGTRLPGYEYITIYAETLSFFSSKLAPGVSKCLAGASSLVGKKSAAFLKKGGLFNGKALGNLMRAMEKEGMCVNWSELILSAEQAEALGKRIDS
ncbi:hypothetical protein MASR2M78_05150 [Treponema sp.]